MCKFFSMRLRSELGISNLSVGANHCFAITQYSLCHNNPGSNRNCSEPANTYSLMTDAWVELYNPQNQPFNLYAAHTSLDAGPNTFTFHFPFVAAIAARGYLVVFPNTYARMLNAGNTLRH